MSPHALRIACALAAAAFLVLWRPGAAQAEAAHDTAGVQCVVQSASLNFGRLNPQRSPWVVGEGAARVACQNNTVVDTRSKSIVRLIDTVACLVRRQAG